jgi:hypothetical protein
VKLRDQDHALADHLGRHGGARSIEHVHAAGVGLAEPGEDHRERRLAATRGALEQDPITGRDHPRALPQDQRTVRAVA